jgi:hypothetical protein
MEIGSGLTESISRRDSSTAFALTGRALVIDNHPTFSGEAKPCK